MKKYCLIIISCITTCLSTPVFADNNNSNCNPDNVTPKYYICVGEGGPEGGCGTPGYDSKHGLILVQETTEDTYEYSGPINNYLYKDASGNIQKAATQCVVPEHPKDPRVIPGFGNATFYENCYDKDSGWMSCTQSCNATKNEDCCLPDDIPVYPDCKNDPLKTG